MLYDFLTEEGNKLDYLNLRWVWILILTGTPWAQEQEPPLNLSLGLETLEVPLDRELQAK